MAEPPILIAGAGPTGLVLAYALARRGALADMSCGACP